MLEEADPNAGDPDADDPVDELVGGTSAGCAFEALDGARAAVDAADPGPADPALLDAAAEVTLSEADDDAPNDAPWPPPATTTIATISATPAATAPAASQKRAYRRRRGRSVAMAANRRSTF